MRMNQEVKQKWIKALESGKYKQGTHALKRVHSGTSYYCCLGVLCEIQGLHQKRNIVIDSRIDFGYDGVYQSAVLPGNFGWKSGLLTQMQRELSQMNDRGKTFEEIAEFIRENC